MKLLMVSILALALIIIGIYISKTERKEHRLVPSVKRIMLTGFVIVFFYILAFMSGHRQLAMFGYSAYYVSMMWLFYFLLYFSLEYTENYFERFVRKKLLIALLVCDSLFVLSNNLTQNLFSVKEAVLFTNEVFYVPAWGTYYIIHYAVTSILATMCMVSLIFKCVTAPSFYRFKYAVIAIIMVVMVGAYVYGLQSVIDFSIIGYVAEVICIYYCAFVYTPQRLLQKSISMVVQDMTVGLMVMDLESKIVYCNKLAEEFLRGDVPLQDEQGRSLEAWCKELSVNNTEELLDKTFYRNEAEVVLRVQVQGLLDKKGQVQGQYIMIQDRTEEVNELRQKQHLATHDRLTDLYNKEHFYECAEAYIRDNPAAELVVIFTDIKDFKMINDFFGDHTGDVVLQNYGKHLKKVESQFVAYGRLSNDNFGVLMHRQAFEEKFFDISVQEAFGGTNIGELTFPLIIYVGVYEVQERNLPVSVMCGRAKMAIETIRGNQHKKVAYYDDALRENKVHEQELVADLGQAISQNQLQMYLHPQMNAAGKMLGAEALVRWIHPVKGRIMPDDFIPVFEKNGLIIDVDKHVWELACKQLRKWKDEGRTDIYLSVNLSSRDLYLLDIYQIFTDLVNKYEIDPRLLKLEITETAVMMNFARQLELIGKLRKFGFIVEMDDFGSGYSSLNMLKDIHVDVLKLDMAFLHKNQDTERGKKILQMVIGLSRQLGIPVISEGVETAEQVRFLAEMGCDMFQGYYFAKPMDVESFEKCYFKECVN